MHRQASRQACLTLLGHVCRSWRKDQSGSVAILADWKANRIDALTDVYTLDSQTLEIR